MPRVKAKPQHNPRGLGGYRPAEELSDDEYDVLAPPPKRARNDEDGGGEKEEPTRPTKEKKAEPKEEQEIGEKPAAAAVVERKKPPAMKKTPPKPLKNKFADIAVGEKGGDTVDYEEAAMHYITAKEAAQPMMETMGYHQQQQLMVQGRLESAAKGGKAVEIKVHEGDDGGRGRVTVTFQSVRKQYTDKCPLYSKDEIIHIFAAVMRRQSTKRRKATAAHPFFKIDQVALRSPPIFWSLFHGCYADVERGLASVLSEAEAIIAPSH